MWDLAYLAASWDFTCKSIYIINPQAILLSISSKHVYGEIYSLSCLRCIVCNYKAVKNFLVNIYYM